MRQPAQFALASGKGHGVELSLAEIVYQTVADGVLPACLADAAVSQIIGSTAGPFAVCNLAFHVQVCAGGIDEAKLARARQVGANDFRNVAALRVAAEIGNGDRVLGG